MRLIDADNEILNRKLSFYKYYTGIDEAPYEYASQELDNVPTVPAIPISDIEQIKAEIGSEMNVTRDQYSMRQNDYCDGFVFAMKQVLELIDRHIKEYTE